MRRYNKDKNLGDDNTLLTVIALIFIFIPGFVLFFKYILYMEDRYETWGVVLAFSTVFPVAMLLEGVRVLVNLIRDRSRHHEDMAENGSIVGEPVAEPEEEEKPLPIKARELNESVLWTVVLVLIILWNIIRWDSLT